MPVNEYRRRWMYFPLILSHLHLFFSPSLPLSFSLFLWCGDLWVQKGGKVLWWKEIMASSRGQVHTVALPASSLLIRRERRLHTDHTLIKVVHFLLFHSFIFFFFSKTHSPLFKCFKRRLSRLSKSLLTATSSAAAAAGPSEDDFMQTSPEIDAPPLPPLLFTCCFYISVFSTQNEALNKEQSWSPHHYYSPLSC